MSQTPQSLLIVNDFGQLDFNSDGTYTLITKEQLMSLAKKLEKSGYGVYLENIKL